MHIETINPKYGYQCSLTELFFGKHHKLANITVDNTNVTPYLESNNIKLAPIYGAAGATLDQVLNNDNPDIWWEIPIRILYNDLVMTPKIFETLLNTQNVILYDHEDAGTEEVAGQNSLHNYLEFHKIKITKPVLFATGDSGHPYGNLITRRYEDGCYPKLNVHPVTIPFWLLPSVNANTDCVKAQQSEKLQNEYLNFLRNQDKQFAWFPNFKGRTPRLQLLYKFDELNILDQLDWSLILGSTYATDPFVIRFNHSLYLRNPEVYKIVKHFKEKYDIPKYSTVVDKFSDVVTAQGIAGKFKYHINCESFYKEPRGSVILGHERTLKQTEASINCETIVDYRTQFISEKTFKALATGAIPLTLMHGDYVSELRRMGFAMPDLPFSTKNITQEKDFIKMDLLVEYVREELASSDRFDLDMTIHNAKIATNPDLMIKMLFSDLQNAVSKLQ